VRRLLQRQDMLTELFWSLGLFALASTLSPGGATALITASGAQFGFLRSLRLLMGLSFGLTTLAFAAALGLSGLLLAVPSLQSTMKWIGTVYLLFLAWQISRRGPPGEQTDLALPLGFWAGAGLLWMNPKAWAMTTSAAASFSVLSDHLWTTAVLLGTAFALASVLSLSIWCATGVTLARLLRTDKHWYVANRVMGVLLAASIIPIWLT
jgi:threonine/homoserine/homoserine lactone efflux protein